MSACNKSCQTVEHDPIFFQLQRETDYFERVKMSEYMQLCVDRKLLRQEKHVLARARYAMESSMQRFQNQCRGMMVEMGLLRTEQQRVDEVERLQCGLHSQLDERMEGNCTLRQATDEIKALKKLLERVQMQVNKILHINQMLREASSDVTVVEKSLQGGPSRSGEEEI